MKVDTPTAVVDPLYNRMDITNINTITTMASAARDSAKATDSERASRANAKPAIDKARTVRRQAKSVSS